MIPVLINGLPGNMARTVFVAAMKDNRFQTLAFSMTGPEIPLETVDVEGFGVTLIHPPEHEKALARIQRETPGLCAVDFTHPSAVNANAALYCRLGIPFVMGTTGGNRQLLADTVLDSGNTAVIAPNMAKPIVGLQAMMQWGAENFPELFAGYRLHVRESHQKGKADTSGTARAMVQYFNAMGVPFDPLEIEMVRDPEIQRRELHVPEGHIGGHGWHTYTLVSKDDTVTLSLTHNVNGRDVYALGTLDAVAYLDGKLRSGKRAAVYSMIDVLKGR